MLRCTCEASVFIGQQLWCVRIAVTILCIFWHSVHTPRAVKYITCRVMSFRPWQASNGPLRGLSCLHGGIALIPSIPIMSCPASPFISSIFFASVSVFGDFLFFSFYFCLPPLLPSSFSPSFPNLLPFGLNFLCPLAHGRHLRPACHGVPQLTAVPWSRNPTLTLGFHPEII